MSVRIYKTWNRRHSTGIHHVLRRVVTFHIAELAHSDDLFSDNGHSTVFDGSDITHFGAAFRPVAGCARDQLPDICNDQICFHSKAGCGRHRHLPLRCRNLNTFKLND